MNLRHGLAALTLAAGSLVSVPALAQTVQYLPYPAPTAVPVAQPAVGQPVYAQPAYGQPVYAQPAYPQQAQFARRGAMLVARLRARMDQIDQRVRAGVSAGVLAPQALNALALERSQVDAACARMQGDGVYTAPELTRLERRVDRMDRIDEQYRVRVAYPRRGGYRWR